MTNPKWETGPVKLVNGWDATIYRYCENRKRYIGEVKDDDGWFAAAEWRNDGRWDVSKEDFVDYNLAPPPKKTVRVQLWINVYTDGPHALHPSKESALAGGEHARFACIEIDREVAEGEGL